MGEILQFKDLDYFYENHGKKVVILEQANFTFEEGKLYTILGPSGSGKTTTLSLAAALDAPKGGDVIFKGQSIKEIGFTKYRNSKIGIIFQSYNLLPYMNALQNVQMAMEITSNKIENSKERAYQLLEHVGISRDKARRNVNKLSGGEQQRVAIARAISTDANLILADEPTGNLDTNTAQEVIDVFKSLAHDDGKCVIAVTHSIPFSEQADVIIKLENGKLLTAENSSAA
jgi:putative ABC transport system ATP-binding protein